MPQAPKNLLDRAAFRLTADEAQFIIDRLVATQSTALLAREVTRLAWLKRSLTVYRLAFGQPRQDDLMDYLQTLTRAGIDTAKLSDLQIRLEPGILDDPAR